MRETLLRKMCKASLKWMLGNTVTWGNKQNKTKEAVCEYLRADLMTYLYIDIFKLKKTFD